MSYEHIPAELREYRQFVTWRSERRDGSDKLTKVPYSPLTATHASVTDPATWGSFDEAMAAHRNGGVDGIGSFLRATILSAA